METKAFFLGRPAGAGHSRESGNPAFGQGIHLGLRVDSRSPAFAEDKLRGNDLLADEDPIPNDTSGRGQFGFTLTANLFRASRLSR
jgi:hypothetical protein